MDGYQAAKIIKSRQARFVPIIFMTAMKDESSLVKCIEAGGDDFITKPYSNTLLNSKINSMLRISGLYEKIENKNKEIQESHLILQQEMTVTKKLFKKIIRNDMRGEKTGLNYSLSPMTMFNGDLILAERNQTNGLDILVGDFTGHGLSAAIGAIPVSDIFHTMTQKCFNFTETLNEINIKLIDLMPTHMFMACTYIHIDRSNNVLSLVSCGLPDVYLYRNGEIIRVFKSKNLPLGINNMDSSQLEVEMEPLEYGDRLYVATDGIMEAANDQEQMYGLNRLLKVFAENTQSVNLFNSILDDCRQFCAGAAQTDDITLLEYCHQKNVEYKTDVEYVKHREPADWAMQFSLDIQSLRQFDVLPYIMQGVNQLQPLNCGRTSVHTVLAEMFANALDHGVLKLDSSIKDTPQGYMEYYKEKKNRLETATEGNIQISLKHELNDKGGRLSMYVVDSGEGYDYKDIDVDKNKFSGRGLKLVSSLCTDMKILGKGNSIMAYYDWEKHSRKQ